MRDQIQLNQLRSPYDPKLHITFDIPPPNRVRRALPLTGPGNFRSAYRFLLVTPPGGTLFLFDEWDTEAWVQRRVREIEADPTLAPYGDPASLIWAQESHVDEGMVLLPDGNLFWTDRLIYWHGV